MVSQVSVHNVEHTCESPITSIRLDYEVNQTRQLQIELESKFEDTTITPEEIVIWHRLFNPLQEHYGQGRCHTFSVLSGLPFAAAVLIAYARGFNPSEGESTDARNFYRSNGTYQKNSFKIGPAEQNPLVILQGVDVPAMLVENIAEMAETGIERENLGLLFFASELMRDVSDIPLSSTPNVQNYLNGEPCGEREGNRCVAYRGFTTIVESVEKLESPTLDEQNMRLQAIEHLLSMINSDVHLLESLHENFYSEYRLGRSDFRTEAINNPVLASNTGCPELDARATNINKVHQAGNQLTVGLIDSLKDVLVDPESGLVSQTSRGQFKGIAHEAMWLIDAIMYQYVYPETGVEVSRALTRQDQNIFATKPEVKASFDYRIKVIGKNTTYFGGDRIQLKSSEIAAGRSTYNNGIAVLVETQFNDANPSRIIGKLNAYMRIVNGEVNRLEAKQLYERYALKSVTRLIRNNT